MVLCGPSSPMRQESIACRFGPGLSLPTFGAGVRRPSLRVPAVIDCLSKKFICAVCAWIIMHLRMSTDVT